MPNINETAYPGLKSRYTLSELRENFNPSPEEIAYMSRNTRDIVGESRVVFMVILKCYQTIGRPISLHRIPDQIIQHVSQQLNLSIPKDIYKYHKSTRFRHIKYIRQYLQISTNKVKRKRCMKAAALDSAKTKENLTDIINSILDHLINNRFEIPSYNNILRLSRASRKIIASQMYLSITASMSPKTQELINNLFILNEGVTQWWQIKQEVKKPTTKNIRSFLNHLQWLKSIKENVKTTFDEIPHARMESFISEAISLDSNDMKRLVPIRRYSLALMLINNKVAAAVDDLCRVLILWVRRLHTHGKMFLDEYRKAHILETDDLIELLHNFTSSIQKSSSHKEYVENIEKYISNEAEGIVKKCENYLLYKNNNYYPFMQASYQNKRSVIFTILEHLDLNTSTSDQSILLTLELIKKHTNSMQKQIRIRKYNKLYELDHLDLSWLSDRWAKVVIIKSFDNGSIIVDKLFLELAILDELTNSLSTGDLYVGNGYVYDNPNKQLISQRAFKNKISSYCELVKFPSNPSDFVSHLQKQLLNTAISVDQGYIDNIALTIKNNMPILKKNTVAVSNIETERISDLISDKIPLTNIVDVMSDVEKWSNISNEFKPLSGYESKIPEHSMRFIATSFAYGCNIGPSQGARCLQKYSRKQLAWVFNHQTSENNLTRAIRVLINKYNKFEVPRCWGSGESVSVDGTYWDMYKKNLLASRHIRYGQFGGIGYYHVSDKYIALYGNFISCGIHESNYIFDGIIENHSEIQPEKIHGDTGAQTEIVFGFAYLLGVKLMPRIRNFKHLKYYKSSSHDKFKYINDIFCEQNINWDCIRKYYHDMLRIVMSVRAGKIKPSTILRRYCSRNKKNKLYFAFRELGRAARTIFLLHYINNEKLRNMIQAGTCKSEEFNNFISWMRFGDGGSVGDNMSYNQQKIIKFGHLVANMVILHVTASMTNAINELRKEGHEIDQDIISGLSPYRTEHINRLGVFKLDTEREVMELEYNLCKY